MRRGGGEPEAPLREVLRAQIAADHGVLRRVVVQSGRGPGRVGGRIPLRAIVDHRGLVEPGSGEVVVLERPGGEVLTEVDGFLEGVRAAKVADVGLVTIAEAQLRRRVRAYVVGQLAAEQRLPERRRETAV